MECKKDIRNLIEGIDEFKEKYVTYRTKALRTILVKTLSYIKRKEQECEELKRQLEQAMCLSEGALRLYANRQNIKYKQALDEIESLCKNEGCSPCKELEENNHCDECHNKIIQDIINAVKGS